MKWAYFAYAGLIALPLALQLARPLLLTRAAQLPLPAALTSILPQRSDWRVQRIQNGEWQVDSPDGTRTLRLAGLAHGSGLNDQRWQAEANGILAPILQQSEFAVQVQILNGNRALVRLPNGTLVQQILLESGLAQLDETQAGRVPTAVWQSLSKAQSSARVQHKNIWGDT